MSVDVYIFSSIIRDGATTARGKRNENIVPRRDISATLPSLRNVSDLRVENPAENEFAKILSGEWTSRGARLAFAEFSERTL